MGIIDIDKKECRDCGIIKPMVDFYTQNKYSKNKGNWVYIHPECKDCTKKRSTQWTNENREKAKVHNVKYKKTKRAKEKRKTVWMKNYRDSGKRKEWEINNKDKLIEYGKYRVMNKTHEINKSEWESCKEYFNNSCGYCGLTEELHKEIHNQELHKEHVDHTGANDLSNCIPACRNCNSQKWEFSLNEWYNEENDNFTYERLKKILKWLNQDYLKYISK